MKRKAAWLTVPVLLGVVAYSTKYRLAHPPLSQGDMQLRQIIDLSDEAFVDCIRYAPDNWCAQQTKTVAQFQRSQFDGLQNSVRLLDAPLVSSISFGEPAPYGVRFYRNKQLVGVINIDHSNDLAYLQDGKELLSHYGRSYDLKAHHLHPRFARHLEVYLNKITPDVSRKS